MNAKNYFQFNRCAFLLSACCLIFVSAIVSNAQNSPAPVNRRDILIQQPQPQPQRCPANVSQCITLRTYDERHDGTNSRFVVYQTVTMEIFNATNHSIFFQVLKPTGRFIGEIAKETDLQIEKNMIGFGGFRSILATARPTPVPAVDGTTASFADIDVLKWVELRPNQRFATSWKISDAPSLPQNNPYLEVPNTGRAGVGTYRAHLTYFASASRRAASNEIFSEEFVVNLPPR